MVRKRREELNDYRTLPNETSRPSDGQKHNRYYLHQQFHHMQIEVGKAE
jgi:hypothetical protein